MQNEMALPTYRLEGFEDLPTCRFAKINGLCAVYVFAMEDSQGDDYVKIGLGANLKHRLKTVRIGSPFEINLACSWLLADQDSAIAFEHALHTQFEPFHVRGEWFSVDAEFVQRIGDLLIRGRDKEAALLWDYLEDAELADELGQTVIAEWNRSQFDKLLSAALTA